FEPEVVPFAGPFADAGEDGVAAVGAGDAGDELLEDDGLAETGPAEEARLAAADERGEEVDDFDAGLEDFGLRRQVGEFRRLRVDRPGLLRVHRTAAVDRLAEKVEDAAEGLLADGDLDGGPGVDGGHAAIEAFGGAEGDAADAVAAEVLLDLA